MRKISKLILLGLAAAGCALPVAAQNVYRCGNSYSQQPCADGRLVAASDSRSASQKAQTDRAAKQDAKSAAAMEKARLKEEAKPAPVGLPPPKASEAQPAKKPASGAKLKKPEQFTAVAPGKPDDDAGAKPKKKKAKKDDA
jgi:hypothetical protein